MDRARAEFEAAGVGLVLIGQATPRDAADFRRRRTIELPVLADEQRVSYKAAGTRMADASGLLSPKVVAKGVMNSLRTGMIQTRTIGSNSQLGGTLVIAPGGRVLWSHVAKDASDNASPEEILAGGRSVPTG